MTSGLSFTLSIVCLAGSALPVAAQEKTVTTASFDGGSPTLNTRLEPIDAQTRSRDEGNRDPRLRIDSPRDGAVVAAGETLQVTVSSPNRTRFIGITVVMEDPIDTSDQEATSLPAHFAIKIHKSIKSGLDSLSALAGLAGLAGRAGRAGRDGRDGELRAIQG